MQNYMVGCYNIIESNNQILLVKESRKQDSFSWALPAGKVEVGETLTQTASREAFEETGLRVEPVNLIGIYHTPELRGNSVINFAFYSKVYDGELTSEARFFTRAEIEHLKTQKLLRDFIVERIIVDFYENKTLPLSLLAYLPYEQNAR